MASTSVDPTTRQTITRVAWLYHTLGVRQSSIADRLNISQSRVSRMLEQAAHLGIVQTVVTLPDDGQSAVEAELASAYGLAQADVYSLGMVTDEAQLARELGQWLALQLQAAPPAATTVGFTSWSRSLQEMVEHLRPLPPGGARYVVEMLGDLGPPALQHQAAQHTQRFASLLGAEPVFLRLPGIVPHPHMRDTLLAHNSHAQEVLARIDAVDLALVGVGSGAIVSPLRDGDNYLTGAQVAQAVARGAVGEVNLRFIDEGGVIVPTDVDDLIVGADVAQLRRPARRLAVAGGPSKYCAIRAALVGGWVNEIVTDATTAQWLLAHRDVSPSGTPQPAARDRYARTAARLEQVRSQ